MAVRDLRSMPWLDAAVAGALAVALLVASSRIPVDEEAHRLDAGGYLLIAAAAGALAARWRWPLPTLAAGTAALAAYAARGYEGGPVYLTLLLSVYAVASTQVRQTTVVAAGLATATVIGAGELLGNAGGWIHVVFVSWVAAAVILAEAATNRRAYRAGLEERARRLEESREEEARRRVVEERLRIARDVHDIVAHSIASINVQAGVAAHVIERRPHEAREALMAIKQASKEALDELRATLGILRDGQIEAERATDAYDDAGRRGSRAPRAPAPGLDQLDGVIEATRRAGVAVGVRRHGSVRPLPPAVDGAAFRIVQEALTNVVRHAGPGADAEVDLTYADGSIDLLVVDGGPVPASVRAPADRGGDRGPDGGSSVGHGLEGMRERAAILGGWVEAGARGGADPGFRVEASLPTEVTDR